MTYILYDGDCGFCNFWVKFLLQKDQKDLFLFASLQGSFGQEFLKKRNLNNNQFTTLYVWEPEKAYWEKSSAVIRIAEVLGGLFSLIRIVKLLPLSWRDYIYNVVSKNRKLLFFNTCHIPSEEEKKKFLD